MRRPNFKAPLTLEELDTWNAVLDDELRMRLQLAFASQSAANTGFGIVDALDPTKATVTSESPLGVSVNTSNPTTVDVNAGTVVFPNGEIVPVNKLVQQFTLASTAGNSKNVVFVYFSEQDSEEKGLTRGDVLTPLRVEYRSEPVLYLASLQLADYLALPPEEFLRIVPLAVVSVEVAETTNTLVIDMGTSVLSTNRPWFTAVDLEHRSRIGTGAVTSTNPHGTSLNDMSAGNGKTLFQLLLNYGMIVGKDISMAKVPGTVCTETVLSTAVLVDASGAITSVVGARYMRLSRFPLVILGATNAANTKDYGLAWVPGTPVVFFNPLEPWDGGDVVVYYSAVAAAEPPIPLNQITVALSQPLSSEETMIAGGVSLAELTQPTLTFEDAGQVASRYSVYVGKTGAVARYPQTIVCMASLAAVGGASQTLTLPFPGPAPIRLAITKAVPGASLSVVIQIKGTSTTGATLTENVTFNGDWGEPTLPFCGELANQFLTTTNTFQTVQSWTVLSRTNDGPATQLMMWAAVTPVNSSDLADVLPVADITWDGFKICQLKDTRPVATEMKDPTSSKFTDGAKALAEVTPVVSTAPAFLFTHWTEDFNQPTYIGKQWTENTVGGDDPLFTVTAMQKTVDGLGPRSSYVSRAVPVRPHTVAPRLLRFIPFDPGAGFAFWLRVMTNDSPLEWTPWFRASSLSAPYYTFPLTGIGGAPLIKWQVAMQGDCKGYVMIYCTGNSAGPPGSGLVYDVGAWDEGAWG